MNKLILHLLLLFVPTMACAQSDRSKVENQSVEYFVEDPCFSNGHLSIALYDLQADSLVLDINSKRAQPPASVLKILTTASALHKLGKDYTFKTKVGYTGQIVEGVLQGDLVIQGLGDPTWGSVHIDQSMFSAFVPIIESIHQSGIKVIEGDIVGDASLYSMRRIPRTWPYQDMGNYYGAFCAGLNLADNMHLLHFDQVASEGQDVTSISISPEVPDLEIVSMVKAGSVASGDNAYVMGAPFQVNRFVQGTIPPGKGTFTIKGSVPDPALFASFHLKKNLVEHGVEIRGIPLSSYNEERKITDWIYECQSPDLASLARLTNEKSINLFAEGIGMKAHDSPEAMLKYWENIGVDMDGCRLADFAGLSPDNALTGQAIVGVLARIYGSASWWEAFLPTLAIAGETGTLRGLLRNSSARGKVYAKSGLISGTRNYAGYIHASDKWYAFSIMSYNASCSGQQLRKKLEQLLETLYLGSAK